MRVRAFIRNANSSSESILGLTEDQQAAKFRLRSKSSRGWGANSWAEAAGAGGVGRAQPRRALRALERSASSAANAGGAGVALSGGGVAGRSWSSVGSRGRAGGVRRLNGKTWAGGQRPDL
eukprot:EG_transcript_21808